MVAGDKAVKESAGLDVVERSVHLLLSIPSPSPYHMSILEAGTPLPVAETEILEIPEIVVDGAVFNVTVGGSVVQTVPSVVLNFSTVPTWSTLGTRVAVLMLTV